MVLVGRQDGLRDTVLPRLNAAGADPSRVHVFGGRVRDSVRRAPSFPEDCDKLRETVEETGARLIVLDPLIDFLSQRACSLNEQMVLQALAPLAQLADQMHAAMAWVRHLNKGGQGQRALYRGSGSMAIIGIARTAFLVGAAPWDDDLGVLACSKNDLDQWPPSLGFRIHRNDQGKPVIDWTGPVDVSADELVLKHRLPYGAALNEAKQFLHELLAQGPAAADEVQRRAHEAGISEGTLRRAKLALGVESSAEGFGNQHQWSWSLSHGAAEPMLEPVGEQRAEALKAAAEKSRRFLEELCQRQKTRSP